RRSSLVLGMTGFFTSGFFLKNPLKPRKDDTPCRFYPSFCSKTKNESASESLANRRNHELPISVTFLPDKNPSPMIEEGLKPRHLLLLFSLHLSNPDFTVYHRG
ncbi:MAG: hypothetical protein CW342_09205, partial [Thermoactinomycetaceae bacterium]|nr:hypothetical protein [Thermoactinomycetaceae bacterium]